MSFLRKISIRSKLIFSFSCVVILLIVFMLIGLNELDNLMHLYNTYINSQIDAFSYLYSGGVAAYVSRISSLFAIMAIILISSAVVFSYWMIRLIYRPISKLKMAMAEVTKGNLTHPIRIDTFDELGDLSQDIANMVNTISETNKVVTVADFMDVLICVTDLDNKFVYVNKAYAEAYSIDKDNYEGKICYELTGYNEPCPFCPISNMKTDEPYTFQDMMLYYDPRIGKWFNSRSVIIKWPDGRWVNFYYLQDATRYKYYMDQHHAHEEDLQRSLSKLQSLSVAKSVFISNTSQDIHSSINNILGYSQLMLEGNHSSTDKTTLQNIVHNTEHLMRVVDNVLNISQLESGRINIENVPFDINDIVKNCQMSAMPRAIAKNIMLHFYAEPYIGKKLVGDPAKLSAIFINLLSNGIKFTDYGVVKCSWVIKNQTPENSTILFEFSDSGVGMTKEQIEHILNPISAISMDDCQQTRLGLIVTKMLIEKMGGQLTIISEKNVGSKFSFELTFRTYEETEPRPETTQKFVKKPRFNKQEVLVIEDNELHRALICEQLDNLGLLPFVAENGMKAIEILQKRIKQEVKPFDLIFIDVHMPVMSGIETTTAINSLNTETPIIAMTSTGITKNYMDGVNNHIIKPFADLDLWRLLLQYLTPVDNYSFAIEDIPYTETEEVTKNEPTTAPTTAEKLDEYSNFDNSNGDEFLRKIQVHFVKSNQDLYANIENAIKEGDLISAHRMVHNLKSNSGHINKKTLQIVATNLEYELKNGTYSPILMKTLKEELETTLEELAPLIAVKDKTEKANTLSKEEVQKMLEIVDALLSTGNAACLDYIGDLEALPNTEELVAHIENFDFTNALVSLSIVKEEWDSVI
ncbi:MAG: response regulator [Defluviitaleaceae bacterium]|nr:response regulator [Defluviitaleaceae bacterium]